MTTSGARKQENFLRLIPIQRTPDQLAQLELVEGVNRLKVRDKKPRRFHKLAAGELFPLRSLGRVTDDAVEAQCSEVEFMAAVMPAIRNMIRAKFRKAQRPTDTGEFDNRYAVAE